MVRKVAVLGGFGAMPSTARLVEEMAGQEATGTTLTSKCRRKPKYRTEGTVFMTYEPYVRPHAKVGRNDQCPCGSGRKFKQCCLEK